MATFGTRLAIAAASLALLAPGALAVAPPPPAVPPAVAATREALITNAKAGNYAGLAGIAARAGTGFTYHRGFELRKPVAYWRAETTAGRMPLARLAGILQTPFVVEDGMWVWPAAAAAKPVPAAWEALKAAYPASQVAGFREEGYTGWRCAIDAKGRWRRFLRG